MAQKTSATDLTDTELYDEYQEAKQDGPVWWIDDLRREIAERWEAENTGNNYE